MTRVVAAALAVGAVACSAALAQGQGAGKPESSRVERSSIPSVTVAILPHKTEPEDLERFSGLAPGTMSAGLSSVTPAQTFLDIGAGNRVFTSLYGPELPVITRFRKRVPGWALIVERAEDAPAQIVPGLLGTAVRDAGLPIRADSLLTTPALMAADERGRVGRTRPWDCLDRACDGVAVVPVALGQLQPLIDRLRGDDLLIAMERPPPGEREVLALGLAGEGYEGNVTSDTTRTGGFALTTDIGPTILDRLGIPIPDEMAGHRIRSEGDRDVAAVQERSERMKVVSKRRAPVALRNMMIWFALAIVVALASRGRFGRPAFALAGLSAVYLPAMLLVGAAVRPDDVLAERLIVGLGAPLLAALTLLLVRGWGALAVGCAVTLTAYAVDIVAGSPLTAQSILGPNPGLGVRFFGIGNELESTLAVVIPVGVGAALAALAARGAAPGTRAAVAAFLVTGAATALLFAAGRFGADVVAAIVFPAGAATAAPVLGLALLVAVDLVFGGDAHLSRSVLDAGGASDLADVVERRLRLAGRSFKGGIQTILFWFCVASVIVAVVNRRRILRWLAQYPYARAGYAGAASATALGVVANDSSATFFTVGTIALIACVAYAWSQTRPGDDSH